MAVALEIIELHKLRRLIASALDVNDNGNVIGFYFDDKSEVPKYKLDAHSVRIKHQLLPNRKRTEECTYETIKWNSIHDRDDNDFQSLVDQVNNLIIHEIEQELENPH